MSVSIKEVLESAGYDFSTKEDCEWLLAQASELDEMLEEAEDTIDSINYKEGYYNV